MTLHPHTCYICNRRSRRLRQVTPNRWRCGSKKRCRARRAHNDRNDFYRSYVS